MALVVFGSYQVTRLPIDAVPDITNNQVQVITVSPSFGATDIERLVTFPIEMACGNVPGIKEIRSFSRFGLSLVTIVFDDATDVYWARQQVSERLQKVANEIPAGVGRPELAPVTTGLGEIYQYVVKNKRGFRGRYSETELRTIQDWIVRRQLLGVEGVAEVSGFGGKVKQFSIATDQSKLAAHNVTIAEICKAVEDNNQNTGGSYIEKGPTVLVVRTEGLLENIAQIENIHIKYQPDGTPLCIKDVATVEPGHATRYGAMCYNTEGEVAGAVVMMVKGGNSNLVIAKVKERMEQIKATLPEGVAIEPFLDRTKMVDNAIGTVKKNLMEGALIVVFVLVLFLGNYRAGLLVASVIPLSMLFAVILMNLFGVGGNLMSLGALDFGLIVDGAVIIVEAVMHTIALHGSSKDIYAMRSIDTEVEGTAKKMMGSAMFGQMIILVVYLPIFTLQGIEGKMFKPMAMTVAFALLGAFLLSLTYIPMMAAWVLGNRPTNPNSVSESMMSFLENRYRKALVVVMGYKKTVVASVIVLFGISLYVFSGLGGEFIPTLEEGDFAVDTRVLTGSNLATTIGSTQQAVKILKERFPEVEKVVTKIGCGEVPTDPMPMDACDMMVILKDKKDWVSAKSFDELAAKMGNALAEVPGITTGFQFPVQMRFNELMTGARQDIVCKIFGDDLDTLSFYAEQLGALTNGLKGAKDVFVEKVTGMPQVVVTYDRQALKQYGLSVAEVNKTINAAFAGQSCGVVYEGEKRFDAVVRLSESNRKSTDDLERLMLPTSNGTVPLRMLARVEIKEGPVQVQREGTKRRITVGFNVRGADVQSLVDELQARVARKMKLPVGYYITYGGAFENLNAAKDRLAIAVPIALALIFILLYFAFSSVAQSLLIYAAIPLSAIGGIFFLALRGMPFSISAGVGFIALFGVAVLNGIVLVAEFNRLAKSGGKPMQALVLEGAVSRLRPVLITALVASLGFLPMALSNGAGAEVQRPLATVVIGGLLMATFLTLFVLPVSYLMIQHKSKPSSAGAATKLVMWGLLFLPFWGGTQSTIGLQAAIDSALANNLSVRAGQSRAGMMEKRIGTFLSIPKTNLTTEIGQINSAYTDTKLGIYQAIELPAVYKRERKLLESEWKSAKWGLAEKQALLKKEVRETFCLSVLLRQKQAVLAGIDSLFTAALQRASERLTKGESNLLEKSSLEIQSGQTQLLLANLVARSEQNDIRFAALINTADRKVPARNALKLPRPSLRADTAFLQAHPILKKLWQEQASAEAAIEVEKAKWLPSFGAGYANQSIRGLGNDEKAYNASDRFGSVQFGMQWPLFQQGKKEKMETAKLARSTAAAEYLAAMKEIAAQWDAARSALRNAEKSLTILENGMLPSAEKLLSTANLQFQKGAIGFLEWAQIVNQYLSMKGAYLDALDNYDQAVIAWLYVTGE